MHNFSDLLNMSISFNFVIQIKQEFCLNLQENSILKIKENVYNFVLLFIMFFNLPIWRVCPRIKEKRNKLLVIKYFIY